MLTTNQLDALSYYGVASLRLLVSDPLFFLLGMWYGDAAIRWVERKWASQGEMLRWFERAFGKAAYPLVFLAPNNPICLFAGASGMAIPVFLVLNVSGTFARLYAIRVLGATFESPIDARARLLQGVPPAAARRSRSSSSASRWCSTGASGGGEIEAIRDLEEELEDDR